MKTVLHKNETRGHADLGWLNSKHTFSFAGYHNPERTNFGVLRVLNDDIVHSGGGFSTHPHDNMEIISIPLEGDLEHKDSMGNIAIINEGDIQVMSAGTGIHHSERNRNQDKDVKFLQIWIYPNKKNVEPRYDQISIRNIQKENSIFQILSPNPNDEGVWIHQNAWFSLGVYDKGREGTYHIKSKENGVYLFVLEGSLTIEHMNLSKRDGLGIWDTNPITFKSTDTLKVLIMDIPMKLAKI